MTERKVTLPVTGDRGEIIPAGLAGWTPLPPREDGVSLSDALIALREEERG